VNVSALPQDVVLHAEVAAVYRLEHAVISPRKDDRRDRDYERRDRGDRSRTPDDRDREAKDEREDGRENGTNGEDRKVVDSPAPAHDELDTAE